MVVSGGLRTRLQQECRREWDHNDSSQGGCEVQSSICVDESDEKDESTTEGGHGLHMPPRQAIWTIPRISTVYYMTNWKTSM